MNIALDVPLYQIFSYTHHEPLAKGQRVLVNFRHRQVVGFVWDNHDHWHTEARQLKPILNVYSEIIPDDLIKLIDFCSRYYHYPVGSTIFDIIPRHLKQPKPIDFKQ